jgi:hypothetical protein
MRTCRHTGGPLPPNLYNDNRGRPDRYRYRTPSGSMVAVELPYAEAVALAEKANAERSSIPTNRRSVAYWQREFVEYMESQNPELRHKRGWRDRVRYLETFAADFAAVTPERLDVAFLSAWWDAMTFDQQHNRRPVLSKFFVYMMGQGVARCNPFTNRDDVARLLPKAKPRKSRLPLHERDFWRVHELAPEWLQDAMIISLATTLRRADVCALRFDAVVDGELRVTIGKSVGQRGFARASHLAWRLEEHELLRDAINRARERSLRLRRCPYVVATKPARLRTRAGSDHPYRVPNEALSRAFAAARDASGIWEELPAGRTPPTFHEIRGLAIERLLASGADLRRVQRLAAHTDESVTSGYAANHAPEFELVDLVSPVKRPA